MSARDVYQASLKSAESAKVASLAANELAKQESINVTGCNSGYHPGVSTGSSASYEAAVRAANAAKFAADLAAEQTKQAAIAVARDTLKSTGDVGAT